MRGQDPHSPMVKNSDAEDTIFRDVAEPCWKCLCDVSPPTKSSRSNSFESCLWKALEVSREFLEQHCNTAGRLHDPIVDWEFAITEHNICQALNVLECTPTAAKKRGRPHDGDSWQPRQGKQWDLRQKHTARLRATIGEDTILEGIGIGEAISRRTV